MILMSVGYAGLFVFTLLAAVTSPMVFDSGDTSRNWAAFFGLLFSPLLVLLSLAVAWCGFGYRRPWLIPLGFALPVLYGVAFWTSFS